MADWPTEAIADCLEKLSLRDATKLQTQFYKDSGTYPIIDQGQRLIAGWTDDESGLIRAELPVVVFGDHTRALKYVDFPFVRGADGTQILKPRGGIDPRFFYYACRAIDLPSRGYNRHFKALKEQEIPLPPIEEQRDISLTLRLVDDALSLQGDALQATEAVKRTAMQALFTRGLRGEAQKETEIGLVPGNWERRPISTLGRIVTGNTPPTKDAKNYIDGDIQFIAPGDIDHGRHIQSTEKHITKTGFTTCRPITDGTTCVVCIGSTIGKVGLVSRSPSATNQQINSIIPRDDCDPNFIFHLMTFWSDHIRKQASPSPVPLLSKGSFEQIEIFSTSDRDEQIEISTILDAIDRKIDLHRHKRAVLDALFKALLHKLMTGDIRVADLDLAALGAPDTAEAAA